MSYTIKSQIDATAGSRRSTSLLLASLIVLVQCVAVSNEVMADEHEADPVVLINEMSEALKSLTYSGTFVHLFQENVETMRILHASDSVNIRERMISLNGEAREVYRNNALVTCIWPGSRSVIVSKSKPRNLLPKVSAELTRSEYYEFLAAPDDRVAGLDTYVIDVKPKDEYRYGYRFWIDKNTKMLLRSLLLDNDQNSLEQLMFTEITFPDSISDSELDADTDTSKRDGYSWIESSEEPAQTVTETARVNFDKLPWGYSKIAETYRKMPMNDNAVSHVMLSDGLASISVYVEYTNGADIDAGSTGVSKMGAMNAYGRNMKTALVTVVGEVPVATVKFIGDAVKLPATSN